MQKRHEIPPLAAVRVFEATARHLSFTRAAEELGMTQAAVSYQIRQLEERIGQPLFVRQSRRIHLTQTGRLLAPAVTEAFQRLAEAFVSARGRSDGVLAIKVHTTFAAHWLAPRIGRFQLRHPQIAVRLTTAMTDPDFATEEIDVGFVWSSGVFAADLGTQKVMDSHFTPMVSRETAARLGPLDGPERLLDLPLADPQDPWWDRWFAAAGVTVRRPPNAHRSSFESQLLESRHVLAGTSVGILTAAYFRAELAGGHLVQLFDLVCRDERSYWLVYPERRRNVPKIKAFREWIRTEAESAAMDQAPASAAS